VFDNQLVKLVPRNEIYDLFEYRLNDKILTFDFHIYDFFTKLKYEKGLALPQTLLFKILVG